jgi:hypothetical protein
MNTQYASRPFADQFTGSIVQDSPNGFILRSTSAVAGGIAITALLAAIFAR